MSDFLCPVCLEALVGDALERCPECEACAAEFLEDRHE